MRFPLTLVIAASSLFACGSSPTPPPPPPDNPVVHQTATEDAPLEVPTEVTTSVPECPVDKRDVPLGSDRILRCRGIPFNVTFPKDARIVQEKVGPGTSFLGLLKPAGLVALAVRPATFETITTNNPEKGLDRSLDLLIEALKSNHPKVDRRYDVRHGNTAGRALDFSYPLGSRTVTGSMRAFLIGGWVTLLMAGGPTDTAIFRGSPEANAFLDSLQIAPRDPNPVIVRLENGAQLQLPPDAWLVANEAGTAGTLRNRMYALPEVGTQLLLQEQVLGPRRCADLMSEQSSRAFVEQNLRSMPDLKYNSVELSNVAGASTIFVEATFVLGPNQLPGMSEVPATAALLCKEPSLLLTAVIGNRPRAEQRSTLESVLATYRGPRRGAQQMAK